MSCELAEGSSLYGARDLSISSDIGFTSWHPKPEHPTCLSLDGRKATECKINLLLGCGPSLRVF